jgi:hypothetical protein
MTAPSFASQNLPVIDFASRPSVRLIKQAMQQAELSKQDGKPDPL